MPLPACCVGTISLAPPVRSPEQVAGRFAVPGLGTFTVSQCAARTGRNPATGEAIKIKASKTVRSKAAPALKEVVAKVKLK